MCAQNCSSESHPGLGVFRHLLLILFTSPTDGGAELFFPLSRLVTKIYFDLDGNRQGEKRANAASRRHCKTGGINSGPGPQGSGQEPEFERAHRDVPPLYLFPRSSCNDTGQLLEQPPPPQLYGLPTGIIQSETSVFRTCHRFSW